MAFPVGAAITAGASLAAPVIGSLIGGKPSNDAAAWFHAMDRQDQMMFAQHGFRWRVEDAKRAGVHPLYATGGTIPTYSPSSYVGGSGGRGDYGVSHGLAQAGQDIGRAIDATRTAGERQEARIAALAVERGELENDLLRAQISKLNAPQTGPAFPSAMPDHVQVIPGQGDAQGFIVEPTRVPAVQSRNRNQEAGATPETKWVRTSTGGYQPVPSQEAFEDADIGNPSAWSWYWRNQALPTLGVAGDPPPDSFLPSGAIGWRWSPMRQEWRAAYDRDWLFRNMYGIEKGSR